MKQTKIDHFFARKKKPPDELCCKEKPLKRRTEESAKERKKRKINPIMTHVSQPLPSCPITGDRSFHEEKNRKHTTGLSKKVLEEDKLLRTRRIRIHPTEEQKKLFQRWFGIIRLVYNEALRFVTEKGMKPNFFSLRNHLFNKETNEISKEYPFLFDN